MKIEITEVERHFLLAKLGNSSDREIHLHGRNKSLNVDKEALYQKILLAQPEAEPAPKTYWVAEWVPYEGCTLDVFEGTAEAVIEQMRKARYTTPDDYTVFEDAPRYEGDEFIRKFDKGEL